MGPMAALGRILQIIGWLWVLVGLVGPRAGLDAFGLDSIGVFPGLILIFIARAFRARARTEEEPALGEARQQARPAPGEGRSERSQAPSPPAPARKEPPPPAPARREPSPPAERKPEPRPQAERKPEPKPRPKDEDDLLERIALAGRSAAEELSADDLEDQLESLRRDGDERKPMSSEEMIAQARQRWDRPRR
jgi:outer membrane biosynthesis protein TonB